MRMKPLSALRTKGAAFLFSMALAITSHAAGQFVDLVTEVQLYNWGSNRAVVSQVRCLVGTNSWLMEGDFIRNGRQTWWFTGTNLVESTVITKAIPVGAIPGSHLVGRSPQPGERSARVYESPDGNPGKPVRQVDLLGVMSARLCWLAFCSGPCLKTPGRKVFPPNDLWKEIINAPSGFADHVTAFEDTLALPKNVDLCTQDGQPVFQYRVTASTNVCGWNVPLEFYAAQYQHVFLPESHRFTTNGWELGFTAKGRIIQIGPGKPPALPKEVLAGAEK
jgi:hypothetical protein